MIETPELAPVQRTSFHALATDVLHVLYQHRVMSTDQLQRLLIPAALDATYLRRQLRLLHAAGLVERIWANYQPRSVEVASDRRRRPNKMPYLWFLTDEGAESVEQGAELQPRPYRVTLESVAGARQLHTLAVNETGLAFARHAARLGHECGPLDWMPEVAHRIRDGQRRFEDDHVITDAVVNYVHVRRGQRTMLTLFVELDRATMTTARLAAKVAAYGRLHEYVPQHPDRARRSAASTRPAWQYTYPVFPRLLVVLDGKPSPSLGSRLAARTEDLYTLTRADPRLARLAGRLSIGVTTLQLLRERGPFEPIFTPLLRGTPENRPPLTDLYLKTAQ
ncbi:replication-relaxation family protein [Streptomyces sp. RKAG337]|uniref:replication-relaxation family protein n=1 Tax=Streptomyces sp. RKAG337 TaxID=2893404 RepID=UPI002034405F|nr:replication-relaxation family protein [Streptomyces sp. RKAG337]MCM2430896.1 replication-relaxation family protein [Streptomyces sp. RKAG337]